MKIISKNKSGILIYLNQEGRGIGLTNKIKAYALQDTGLDTVEANHALGFIPDEREYAIAADILKDLDAKCITLLTNNPDKKEQLEKNGITVKKQLPLVVKPNTHNKNYLITKRKKLRHIL